MRYCSLILLFACSMVYADLPSPWEAYFAFGVAACEGTAAPSGPVDDTCTNCSGTGKSGDGTTVFDCPKCGGTGKRKTKMFGQDAANGWPPRSLSLASSAKDQAKASVTYWSHTNCQYCRVWEKRDLPTVATKTNLSKRLGSPHGMNPSFEIEHQGRKVILRGYKTAKEILGVVEYLKR